ncbi:MAG: putative primosomal protein [Actinomycetota bacterium]
MNLPYAQIAVETPLLHLDRPFDYAIPPELASEVSWGSRVRVLFGGRKLNGWVVGFTDTVERPERVANVLEVIGSVPLLTPEVHYLARLTADRWVGSLSDVVRSAIAPRQARVEAAAVSALPVPAPPVPRPTVEPAVWDYYFGARALLDHVADAHKSSEPIRATLTTGPGHDPVLMLGDVLLTAASSGRGAIAVVPDRRDLERLASYLQHSAGEALAVLSSDLAPSARYRNFLRVLRGEASIVIGTRSAAFAPVHNLGLVAVLDDGDDSLAEQHSPAWNGRDVLAIRSREAGTHFFSLSTGRSCETQQWIESGWLVELACNREFVRSQSPTVRAVTDADLARDPVARAARLPQIAFATIREGLRTGPVLIHVPRRGYQLNLACARCRERAQCRQCSGPLARTRQDALALCMWCGASAGGHECQWCQSTELRTVTIGAGRTAEELGRAFPDIPVRMSGRDAVLESVPDVPSLVISTPGAEPRVESGFYAAAVLLDAEMALSRVDLRAHEEALRRWQAVVSLVAPESGRVVVAGNDSHPVVQALIRHDVVGFAHRELETRKAANMLPAASLSEVICSRGAWVTMVAPGRLPERVRVLGPVPYGTSPENEELERVLVCSPRSLAAETAAELRAVLALRSSQKLKGTFSVRVDPTHLR